MKEPWDQDSFLEARRHNSDSWIDVVIMAIVIVVLLFLFVGVGEFFKHLRREYHISPLLFSWILLFVALPLALIHEQLEKNGLGEYMFCRFIEGIRNVLVAITAVIWGVGIFYYPLIR